MYRPMVIQYCTSGNIHRFHARFGKHEFKNLQKYLQYFVICMHILYA